MYLCSLCTVVFIHKYHKMAFMIWRILINLKRKFSLVNQFCFDCVCDREILVWGGEIERTTLVAMKYFNTWFTGRKYVLWFNRVAKPAIRKLRKVLLAHETFMSNICIVFFVYSMYRYAKLVECIFSK